MQAALRPCAHTVPVEAFSKGEGQLYLEKLTVQFKN
jgi:hypothetical protein